MILSKIFDHIGRAITSLSAVIFVMLMTITGMILFSHTLFSHVFPDGMQVWEKLAATWFMALGWEFTVLITTCNTKHINKNVPAIMAICSGIIVLFFIQAFDDQQTILTLVQRWFVGILAATINFIYAELFYKKWRERNEVIELPLKVNELESKLNQYQSAFNEINKSYNDVADHNNELEKQVIELTKFKKQVESKLICPYCKAIQASADSLRVHKGHCTSKPVK